MYVDEEPVQEITKESWQTQGIEVMSLLKEINGTDLTPSSRSEGGIYGPAEALSLSQVADA
jgi:hypothetical protein